MSGNKALERPKRIRLSKINNIEERRTLSIPYDGDFLEIVYNRARYTPKFEREIKELMDESLPGNMLSKMLFALIIAWNVEDLVDDPKNLSLSPDKQEYYDVPLTQDTFDALFSVEALAGIVEKMSEDNRPNQKPSDFTSDT